MHVNELYLLCVSLILKTLIPIKRVNFVKMHRLIELKLQHDNLFHLCLPI